MDKERQETLHIAESHGSLDEALSLADLIPREAAPETIDLDIDAALA